MEIESVLKSGPLRFWGPALLFLLTAFLGLPASAQQAVVVVLDDSGSMGESMPGGPQKMKAAKQALLAVLDDLPDDAEVGVYALNSRGREGSWIVPFGPADPAQYRPQIEAIRDGGGTPLGAALKEAAERLMEKRRQQVYGTYRLLVVTDGEATDQYQLDRYLPDLRGRGLLLDVIGVAMDGEHSLASAANTYRRADDPASLQQALAEVFAESGGDDANDGADDFEMLAGLPDGVAAAALNAMTEANSNNEPIEAAEGTQADFSGTPSRGAGSSPSRSVSLLSSCFGCFFILMAAVFGLVVLVTIKKMM